MKKLYAILKLIFISSIILSFNSCEWDGDNDENYVEIDKPSETINLKVDLSGVNPNQVIQIANGSDISYTLSSEGKILISQKFYLDGKEMSTNWYGDITINEPIVDDQIHDLKLVMTFKTGTGSLAELAGVEYYVGEFDFKIKIRERYNNSELNIKQTLDNGTYLKLEWDKPQNIDVGRYEVYDGWSNSDALIAVINNSDETYFVDKTYSYGYKSFLVKAVPTNSINVPSVYGSISVNSIAFTEDNIKASITDSKVTVSWENPNPYPAKYVVQLADYKYVKEVEAGENSVEFDRPPFPFSNGWPSYIYILPLDASIDDYKSYPYTYFFFSDKNLTNYTYSLQLWNKKTNSVLGFYENQFFSHNLLDKGALNNTGTLPFDVYKGFERDFYSLNYNGLIATEGYKNNERNIYIFEGSNFPEKFYTFNNLATISFTISDKYLFYLDESEKNICVADYVTKLIVAKKNVSEKTYYNTVLDISSDGRYIVLYTPKLSGLVTNYTIYEFKDNEIKELRYVEMQITNILFNPQNPSQIIIHDYINQFHIIDVISGNILQTVTNNMYLFADPYTGNILCYSYTKENEIESKYLSVYDNTLTKVLYTVEASTFPQSRSQFILANNLIFTSGVYEGNYVLDISESLKTSK